MLKIVEVDKKGIGYEIGLEKGDSILKFNNFDVQDILDYIYFNNESDFSMTILTKTGETVDVVIEKEFEETLGLTFEDDNLKIKTCRNNCIFCFVDQMPKGMRPSLYVKDDDYRQSFLCGNFITLTNVNDKDIERIIRLNLSPLYVSVQATNSEVRQTMLNNRFAGNILNQLEKLASGGIKIETQIVLVKGLNDGEILEDSLNSLYKLRPNLQSVAIVPCGITKFREGLYPISDFDKGYATCLIEQVRNFNKSVGEYFATLADEFYFKAGLEVEGKEYYGNFLQVGNGVGLTRKFELEIDEALFDCEFSGRFLVVSGESASQFITNKLNEISKRIKGVTLKNLCVKNTFFGETVNCTGLLTAGDILTSLENQKDYDYLVLPDVCLKQDEDVFLDNITLKEFKKRVNKPIIVTDGSGKSFVDAFTLGENIRIIK